MIITPLEAVVGIFMNAISRRFEYQADHFACILSDKLNSKDMTDMGDRLGRALVQLHVKNLSTVWVDWLSVLIRRFYVLLCLFISFFPQILSLSSFTSYPDRAPSRFGRFQERYLEAEKGVVQAVFESAFDIIYHHKELAILGQRPFLHTMILNPKLDGKYQGNGNHLIWPRALWRPRGTWLL
jgi:hypothetical protein